jgi:hypothetical protein
MELLYLYHVAETEKQKPNTTKNGSGRGRTRIQILHWLVSQLLQRLVYIKVCNLQKTLIYIKNLRQQGNCFNIGSIK